MSAAMMTAKKPDSTPDVVSLFARRMARLEQVSIELRNLRRDYTECVKSEMQSKSDQYLHGGGSSHAERDALSRHNTVSLSVEKADLKGQLDVLEEERNFLQFAIEWDAGE